MDHDETVKLLTLVKGNWYRQPTDDLTIRVWQAILADADLRDVWAATMKAIRTMEVQDKIPTAGELLQWSESERKSRVLLENRNLKRIGQREHTLTPEQEEEGRRILKETVAKLTEKLRMRA